MNKIDKIYQTADDRNKFGFVGETTEYKLSDLFNLQMGKTPSRNNAEFWSDGEYKWISIADLTKTGKYISETKELLSQKAIDESGIAVIPTNTVVMSFKLSIGKTAITSEDMYSNEAIMSFHDRHVTELLPEYIYYLLLAQRWDEGANKAVMGMTQNKATLSNRKVRIHSIIAQKSIVERLDKLQKLIDDRKTQLDELETLIKARFVEMFGNPEDSGNEWEQKPLFDLLNVIGGYAFKSDQFSEIGGIPVLRIGNINTGVFRPVNMVYWEDDEKLERYAIYAGDLVMSLTGTVGKDDYGNVCIMGNEYDKYYLNQRNAKLEIKSGLDKYYLSELLKFECVKKKLTGISRGVRQANISNKDILNLVVNVPPIELQNQFAAFVTQVDKLKVEVQKSLDEMQILFDSLMQEYFG